jgi:hypothetical protein
MYVYKYIFMSKKKKKIHDRRSFRLHPTISVFVKSKHNIFTRTVYYLYMFRLRTLAVIIRLDLQDRKKKDICWGGGLLFTVKNIKNIYLLIIPCKEKYLFKCIHSSG